MQKKEQTSEFEKLIFIQIEWVSDLNIFERQFKRIKEKLLEKLKDLGLASKEASRDCKIFLRLYFYLLKRQLKEVTIFQEGYFYVCKVDVFEKELFCVKYREADIDVVSEKLIEILGESPSYVVDYEEIVKNVWKFELKDFFKKFLFVTLIFLLTGSGFWAYQKYATVKREEKLKQQQAQQQMILSDEEKKRGKVLVADECLKMLKSKFEEYLSKEGVFVKYVSVELTESDKSVECRLTITEEYAYPEKETTKTGEFYTKDYSWSKIAEKKEVENTVFRYPEFGNFDVCASRLLEIGFDVNERKGGVVKLVWNSELTGRQAILIPELFQEVFRICGKRFEIKRVSLTNQEQASTVSVNGEFVLWEN